MIKNILLVGILISSFGLTACNQMEPNAPVVFKTGDEGFDTKFDLGNVENSANEAMKMAVATEKALDKVSVDLNIRNSDISIFKVKKLKKKLKDVEENLKQSFAGLDFNLQSLRDKLDQVREELESRISDLDPSDPFQAKVIDKAKKIMDKMDGLELKLDSLVENLTGLLDRLSDKLDDLISQVTSKLGLVGLPVQLILGEIKNELISKLEEKLLSIIGIQ